MPPLICLVSLAGAAAGALSPPSGVPGAASLREHGAVLLREVATREETQVLYQEIATSVERLMSSVAKMGETFTPDVARPEKNRLESNRHFCFKDVVQRDPGRYELQMPAFADEANERFSFLRRQDAPWMPLVVDVLGEDAKLSSVSTFVSLSRSLASPGDLLLHQQWHRDGPSLVPVPLRPALSDCFIMLQLGRWCLQPKNEIAQEGTPLVVFNPCWPNDFMKLKMLRLGEDFFALRHHSGKCVRPEAGGSTLVLAGSDCTSDDHKFQMVPAAKESEFRLQHFSGGCAQPERGNVQRMHRNERIVLSERACDPRSGPTMTMFRAVGLYALVVYIPLEDVGAQDGIVEYLLGSHANESMNVDFGDLEKQEKEISARGLQPSLCSGCSSTTSAGDAIVYDFRVIHRGRKKETLSGFRPILKLDYTIYPMLHGVNSFCEEKASLVSESSAHSEL